MIEYLSISGLGVIAVASVDLDPGFTVVTGETGAGKTMVVTAMNLLLGARADAGAVRHGDPRAVVEAGFSVSPDNGAVPLAEDAGAVLDQDPDGGAGTEDGRLALVVSRTVGAAGSSARSRASAGGRGVPVALLSDLGEHLVAVHGQTDQLRLKSPQAQRRAVDSFAGAELAAVMEQYRQDHRAWRSALSLIHI